MKRLIPVVLGLLLSCTAAQAADPTVKEGLKEAGWATVPVFLDAATSDITIKFPKTMGGGKLKFGGTIDAATKVNGSPNRWGSTTKKVRRCWCWAIFYFSKIRIFPNFQKIGKNEFDVFGPKNGFLRRFGGLQKNNCPNRCLGGDFLGQNNVFKIIIF